MNTFFVVVALIICAHVEAFDVRRVIGSRSQAVSARKRMRLRKMEDGYDSTQPKIAGGLSAEPGQIPFQVSLDPDTTGLCGGVIIHPSYVLTIAQCVASSRMFIIYAGITRLNGDEDSRVIVPSTETIIHEQYDPKTQVNDIALVKLKEPLHFNEFISPALLPTNDEQYVNHQAWISGWGSSYEGGPMLEVLQYASVTVVSNDECNKYYVDDPVVDGQMCTDADSGVGECDYDFGGPLFTDFNREGSKLLIGLWSFGSSEGCGFGLDGFTRVSYYRDWIRNNIS